MPSSWTDDVELFTARKRTLPWPWRSLCGLASTFWGHGSVCSFNNELIFIRSDVDRFRTDEPLAAITSIQNVKLRINEILYKDHL